MSTTVEISEVFARLPLPVKSGDRVDLGADWGTGTVATCHVAEDLRDAKCVVRLDHPTTREM